MKAIEDALGLAEQRAAEVQADRLSGSLWLSRADADNLWRLSEALQAAFTLIEAKRKEVTIDPFTEHPLHRAMASVLEMMLILHCRYPDDPAGVPHPLIPHH